MENFLPPPGLETVLVWNTHNGVDNLTGANWLKNFQKDFFYRKDIFRASGFERGFERSVSTYCLPPKSSVTDKKDDKSSVVGSSTPSYLLRI